MRDQAQIKFFPVDQFNRPTQETREQEVLQFREL